MRNRTIARELALQSLYQLDLRGDEIINEINTFCKNSTEKEDIYQFAIALVNGCRSRIKEIDEKISSVTEHWELCCLSISHFQTGYKFCLKFRLQTSLNFSC